MPVSAPASAEQLGRGSRRSMAASRPGYGCSGPAPHRQHLTKPDSPYLSSLPSFSIGPLPGSRMLRLPGCRCNRSPYHRQRPFLKPLKLCVRALVPLQTRILFARLLVFLPDFDCHRRCILHHRLLVRKPAPSLWLNQACAVLRYSWPALFLGLQYSSALSDINRLLRSFSESFG